MASKNQQQDYKSILAARAKEQMAAQKQMETPIASIPVEGHERIKVSEIEPSPYQPRIHSGFSEEAIQEMADSIREHGVIQPVVVRRIAPHRYELIAGERRWRGAKQAGIEEIEAIIRSVTDSEARLMALVENLQREELSDYEKSLSISAVAKDLREENPAIGLRGLAAKIGVSTTQLHRYMAFENLPGAIYPIFEANPAIVGCGLIGDIAAFRKEAEDAGVGESADQLVVEGITKLANGELLQQNVVAWMAAQLNKKAPVSSKVKIEYAKFSKFGKLNTTSTGLDLKLKGLTQEQIDRLAGAISDVIKNQLAEN